MGIFDGIPTHMDYCGQKLSEQLFQVIAVTFGIIGFIVGYMFQQLCYTMYILAIGCLIGCLVTLPPWPIYRRNPIKWQSAVAEPETQQAQTQTRSMKKKR